MENQAQFIRLFSVSCISEFFNIINIIESQQRKFLIVAESTILIDVPIQLFWYTKIPKSYNLANMNTSDFVNMIIRDSAIMFTSDLPIMCTSNQVSIFTSELEKKKIRSTSSLVMSIGEDVDLVPRIKILHKRCI